jgi:Uma2 family endonuclease
MTTAQPRPKFSYPEYIAREAAAEVKHEFIAGEVFPRPPRTLEHSALALSFGAELRTALIGKSCRVLGPDARVLVDASGAAFYPDVSVAAGKFDSPPNDPAGYRNPIIVVEMLTETTEGYVRGTKAYHYRRVPSLMEYVMVSLSDRRVEVQRRNDRGVWEIHSFVSGEIIELASVGIRIPLDSVFVNPLESVVAS